MQDLFLDKAILHWVLIPITAVMVLVGVLRHYVTSLMDTPPKAASLKEIREQRALMRGSLLRTHGSQIPQYDFEGRKQLLIEAYDKGAFLKEPPQVDEDGKVVSKPVAPPNPMDPSAMEGMIGPMKKQMVMFIPQTVLMGWINFFFTGFIVTKLPFPLTPRFKQMLQAKIETQDMDTEWVSSLSWYILNLFGLNSVYRLLLGDDNAANQARDMQAMNQMAMPSLPGQDFNKLFQSEKESLQLVNHDQWVCDNVEERILKLFETSIL